MAEEKDVRVRNGTRTIRYRIADESWGLRILCSSSKVRHMQAGRCIRSLYIKNLFTAPVAFVALRIPSAVLHAPPVCGLYCSETMKCNPVSRVHSKGQADDAVFDSLSGG